MYYDRVKAYFYRDSGTTQIMLGICMLSMPGLYRFAFDLCQKGTEPAGSASTVLVAERQSVEMGGLGVANGAPHEGFEGDPADARRTAGDRSTAGRTRPPYEFPRSL